MKIVPQIIFLLAVHDIQDHAQMDIILTVQNLSNEVHVIVDVKLDLVLLSLNEIRAHLVTHFRNSTCIDNSAQVAQTVATIGVASSITVSSTSVSTSATSSVFVSSSATSTSSASSSGSAIGGAKQPQMFWLMLNNYQMIEVFLLLEAEFHDSMIELLESINFSTFNLDIIPLFFLEDLKDEIQRLYGPNEETELQRNLNSAGITGGAFLTDYLNLFFFLFLFAL